MSFTAMLKANAKAALQNRWGTSIGMLCITMGLSWIYSFVIVFLTYMPMLTSIMNYSYNSSYYGYGSYYDSSLLDASLTAMVTILVITLFFLILAFFVMGPLLYGYQRWNYNLSRGVAGPFSDVFYYFRSGKEYLRAIGLYFQYTLRMWGWSLLFMGVPMVIYLVIILADGSNESVVIFGTLLYFLLLLAGIVGWVFVSYRYFLTSYLLADQPDMKVSDVFRISVEYTKGYLGKLFYFDLTFFGWNLLVAYFGVVALYVYPYYYASSAMYAQYIIQMNRTGTYTGLPGQGYGMAPGYPPQMPPGTPYNPYGYNTQQPYQQNPYNGQRPYQPNGYAPQQNPYGGQQPYQPNGYAPQQNPYGGQQPNQPNGYAPQQNPYGGQQSNQPNGYAPQQTPPVASTSDSGMMETQSETTENKVNDENMNQTTPSSTFDFGTPELDVTTGETTLTVEELESDSSKDKSE